MVFGQGLMFRILFVVFGHGVGEAAGKAEPYLLRLAKSSPFVVHCSISVALLPLVSLEGIQHYDLKVYLVAHLCRRCWTTCPFWVRHRLDCVRACFGAFNKRDTHFGAINLSRQ